jgi:hypothetical protein
VETLERFTQNQRVIEELTAQSLAGISSNLGRLIYISSIRDVSLGRYRHPALERTYSEAAVHQALLYCHDELFERVLESGLEQQEWDLRLCLAGFDSPPGEIAGRWLELEYFRSFVPFGTPAYLRDLFGSNMRMLLGLLVTENSGILSAA